MNHDNPIEDKLEEDALHIAAEDGDLEEVERLSEKGYDVNLFDEDLSKTPLMYAAEKNHIEVVKFLISVGAKVNLQFEHENSVLEDTVLGLVAQTCSLEMAKVLIEAGADPKRPGFMQVTPLMRAKERKRGDGPKVYELMLMGKKN